MLHLPDVTLLLLTSTDWYGALEAMSACQQKVKFGGAKIVWDDSIKSVDDWNRKVIADLYKYCDTSHMLLIHQDGYVRDEAMWDPEWLKLDYIGSPWPLPVDDYSYRDEAGDIQRVGNSVSLRSRRLMKAISSRPCGYRYGNNNEDGWIACHNRKWLERQGMRFGTYGQALKFGMEWRMAEHGDSTFIFHDT